MISLAKKLVFSLENGSRIEKTQKKNRLVGWASFCHTHLYTPVVVGVVKYVVEFLTPKKNQTLKSKA